MFRQLIAEPSVSSVDARHDQSNRAVIMLLAEWLERLGFSIELMPVAATPEKLNLIARRGSGGDDGLVLAGHTDTVPFDERGWDSDPFALTECDGRLYGLGTADMKSFFPLVLEAVRDADWSNQRKPLVVVATADEESSMAGVRKIVASGRRLGRHAVIGEPTGLQPIRMHKGIMIEAIRLLGHAGHASNPALGNNAIDGMRRVLNDLSAWREELAERYRNGDFAVAHPTLNFGNLHGGDSPNRICAHCELQIDMRLLPDMPFEALRAELRERVSQAVAGSHLGVEYQSLGSGGVPALATRGDSEIVQVLERVSGSRAGSVAFATEGPFLNAMGMETVIFGPGDIAQAHQPNEYLPLDRIPQSMAILKQVIGHFCH